ncbi:hypothetical protein [Streptomyces sp. NPDC048269]|uniref:hypothetical protein n=1 Tax=Streptomyces sp. NPDC048269 TaxID=3155753 RepID=UPI00343AED68
MNPGGPGSRAPAHPAELARLARASGLDFINSSDHHTPSAHAAWGPVAGTAPEPAIASSDYHRDPDRVGTPQTVVLADGLSREAILAGLPGCRAAGLPGCRAAGLRGREGRRAGRARPCRDPRRR